MGWQEQSRDYVQTRNRVLVPPAAYAEHEFNKVLSDFAKECQEKDERDVRRDALKDREAAAAAAPVPAPDVTSLRNGVQVFDPVLIDKVIDRMDKDTRLATKRPLLEMVNRHHGFREVPQFTAEALVEMQKGLLREFPNFAAPIDYLIRELTLCSHMPAEDFHIPPLLLHGAPGVGKTHFAMHLAAHLKVPFLKISGGSLHADFVFIGSEAHWGNSTEGDIVRLLAESPSACPIILLDEIDKIGRDERYPIEPTVLDLFEPQTSRQMRDLSLSMTFDASHIIWMGTANYPEQVSAPLQSRMHSVEIQSPSAAEREFIVRSLVQHLINNLKAPLQVEEAAYEHWAQTVTDLRTLRRQVRDAVARALLQKKSTLEKDDLPPLPAPPVGFGFAP